MESDFYRFYVHDSIARKDVERLVNIWYDTAFMGKEGKEYRELITDAIPDLSEWYNVGKHFRDRSVRHSFREFVRWYDEALLREKYPHTERKQALLFQAVERNNRKVIDRYIAKRGSVPHKAFEIAIKKGNLELVRLFWSLEKKWMRTQVSGPEHSEHYQQWIHRQLEDFLLLAIEQDDAEIFAYFYMERTVYETGRYYLQYIRSMKEGWHYRGIDLLDKIIAEDKFAIAAYLYEKQPFSPWLRRAAKNGKWDFVHFFLDNGADDYDNGLLGAVQGDQMDMILFFMDLGANKKKDMNMALGQAALSDNIKLIDFFVEHGADDFASPLRILRERYKVRTEQRDIIQKTIDHLMHLISAEDLALIEEEERIEEEKRRAEEEEERRVKEEEEQREQTRREEERRRREAKYLASGRSRGGGRGARGGIMASRRDGRGGRGGRGDRGDDTATIDVSDL